MPREDERFRNMSPTHPQYCTCVECVQNRLDGKGATVTDKVGGLVGKIAGKAAKAGKIGKIGKSKGKKRGKNGASGKSRGQAQGFAEPVKKHKANCECATCTLLKSI